MLSKQNQVLLQLRRKMEWCQRFSALPALVLFTPPLLQADSSLFSMLFSGESVTSVTFDCHHCLSLMIT